MELKKLSTDTLMFVLKKIKAKSRLPSHIVIYFEIEKKRGFR